MFPADARTIYLAAAISGLIASRPRYTDTDSGLNVPVELTPESRRALFFEATEIADTVIAVERERKHG